MHTLKSTSRILAVSGALIAVAGLAACNGAGSPVSSGGPAGAGKGRFTVVAAENFWGSIAAQLAGETAAVRSIIVNPSTDARRIAGARMVIITGIGYDKWAPRLIEANPQRGRVVLNVGELLGLKGGANPHVWYSPSDVHKVVERIVADYVRLDPAHAGYFARQRQNFEVRDLARYDTLRKEIRARYAGTPVGYSESIFQPLGEDLGLKLLTPYGFAKAIAEGTEVTAKDKEAVDAQARLRKIKVWVFNSQNVTPDVRRVSGVAAEKHIPIATVTETLSPPSATFEQWQVAELEGLMRALQRATGA
jgi:zinc/manganese transport system substrate-binding protein